MYVVFVLSHWIESILVECSIFRLRRFCFAWLLMLCWLPVFSLISVVYVYRNELLPYIFCQWWHIKTCLFYGISSLYLERNLQFRLNLWGLFPATSTSFQSVSGCCCDSETLKQRGKYPGLGVIWWKSPSAVLFICFAENLCHLDFLQ